MAVLSAGLLAAVLVAGNTGLSQDSDQLRLVLVVNDADLEAQVWRVETLAGNGAADALYCVEAPTGSVLRVAGGEYIPAEPDENTRDVPTDAGGRCEGAYYRFRADTGQSAGTVSVTVVPE